MSELNNLIKNRVTYSPIIANITNSVTAAVFFHQIVFWWDKRSSNSIYKTINEIEYETTLSRGQQDNAIRKLVELDFIKSYVKGLPAKRHFEVNENVIVEYIKNYLNNPQSNFQKSGNVGKSQNAKLIGEKSQTLLFKDNNNNCENITINDAENEQVYTDYTTDNTTNSKTDNTTDSLKNSENEFSQQKKINDFSDFSKENTKTDFQNTNSSKSNQIPPYSAASPLLESENLFQKLKTSFKNFYLSLTNIDYNWTEKDWGTLKLLVQKLKFISKSNSSDIEIINSFNHLLTEVKNNEWILKNLSLSIINMKFNEIVSSIKFNQNDKYSAKRKRGISEELRRELLVGICGNEGFNKFATS